MKKSLPALLVVVVLATLLASCGQSTPRQPQGAIRSALPTQQPASISPKGRIAWQGFLDSDQTTVAIFTAKAEGTDVRSSHTRPVASRTAFPTGPPMAPSSSSTVSLLRGMRSSSSTPMGQASSKWAATPAPEHVLATLMLAGLLMGARSSSSPLALSGTAPRRSSTRSFPRARTWCN